MKFKAKSYCKASIKPFLKVMLKCYYLHIKYSAIEISYKHKETLKKSSKNPAMVPWNIMLSLIKGISKTVEDLNINIYLD